MNKKGVILPVVISSIALAGTIATIIAAKKIKEKNRVEQRTKANEEEEVIEELDDVKYPQADDIEYGFYVFEDPEDMERARLSNRFNVSSYYLLQDKAYLVLLLDGTEEGIEAFNGRRISGEEFEKFERDVSVETMYFEFDNEETFRTFLKHVSKVTDENVKIPSLFYEDYIYVDLGYFEEYLYDLVAHIAEEFLARRITDMYVANRLEDLFEIVIKSS